MLSVCLEDASGRSIERAEHETEAMLCFDRSWCEGDRVVIRSGDRKHVTLRIDGCVAESWLYLPRGEAHWTVPWGEHRLAYAPGVFDVKRHTVIVRALQEQEKTVCRDLARNPADLRGDTDFYPHCTANVETRGESVFAARNVIDGYRFNRSHGEWPFESWGIGAREDAWCLLDFGREVIVSEMALTLRADFPHDAYWVSGHVVTSDGTDIPFALEKTAERQRIPLGDRHVRWLRLERMSKSDDPSAFPSLRAWEVFGRDLPART